MKKRRGHYCWMCGRHKPNEQFSGRGHARHLCKKCSRRPREERERIRALDDLHGFLEQRNISDKNKKRLAELCHSTDDEIRNMAQLILEIAQVKPHRRKRWGYLMSNRPELVARAVELRLTWDHPSIADALGDDFDMDWDIDVDTEIDMEATVDADVFVSISDVDDFFLRFGEVGYGETSDHQRQTLAFAQGSSFAVDLSAGVPAAWT